MKGAELFELVRCRRSVLLRLLEIGDRQRVAIDDGRMNELMGLLGEKQSPLRELGELSQRLAQAVGDDPQSRPWDDARDRLACRETNDQCEQMLRTLIELEAECEQALTLSRHALQQQLTQSQHAKDAVAGYAPPTRQHSAGGNLDLSSG